MPENCCSRSGFSLALLHCCAKIELNKKAKLSIYRSVLVPTPTCGHEGWVTIENMRMQIQAAKMGFLRRVAGISLRDKVRSSDICKGLGVEPMLLSIEWSQLRLRYLVKMAPGRLPREVFQACTAGKRSQVQVER